MFLSIVIILALIVEQYLQDLPLEKTCYIHVAGHYVDDDLIIDTHGASVIDGVWQLLDRAYMLIFERTGKQANDIPTCLERDFNFPPLADLLNEVAIIKQKQAIRQNQGFKTIKR